MPPLTSLALVTLKGTPAYHIKGQIPDKIEDVAGATHLKKAGAWVMPAFRPMHRRSVEDLQKVCRNGLALEPAVQKHLTALDTYDELPSDFDFITKPFKHQFDGLKWAYNHPRAGLFYDPGLGKCKITVDYHRLVKTNLLILCPQVVLRTWAREFVTHGKITDTIVVEGDSHEKLARVKEAQKRMPAALIITYESAVMLMQELLLVKYGGMVADESHRMKSVASIRTKASLKLSEEASRRLLLSGTPTLGSPLSLYPQFRFLGRYFAPEDWPTYQQRYATFAQHSEYQIMGYENMKQLNDRVSRVCIRRTQAECLDLPEQQIIDQYFTLSDEQIEAYNDLVNHCGDPTGRAEGFAREHGLLDNGDGPTRPAPFVWAPDTVAKLNKIEQIIGGFVNETRANLGLCNGCPQLEDCVEENIRPYSSQCLVAKKQLVAPRRFKNNSRKEACRDLLESILENPDNKCIVWTKYLEELAIVQELAEELGLGQNLLGMSYVVVRGGMKIDDFEAAMHRFNGDPACRLYLGQVASGIGVTLNAANYMIYYSLPWSHEQYVQSKARNYRIGQKRKTTVYRLLAEGTTDAMKAAALDLKIDIEDMLTSSDFVPSCDLHNAFGARNPNAECTCDGRVSRILATLTPIA
jgi:SNF2 family DNA or RNA helicase